MTGKDFDIAKSAKDWTDATEQPASAPGSAGRNKKLSLDIPADVHRAEKAGAAIRENTMVGEVIDLLAALNGLRPWPAWALESMQRQLAEAAAAEAAAKPAPRGRQTGRATEKRGA